jgi:site-specific recombinase XerD
VSSASTGDEVGEGGDMKKRCYQPPILLECYRIGPLAPHIDAFAARLLEAGYGRQTARHKLRVVADLSLWLRARRAGPESLDEHTLARFRCHRRRYDAARRGDSSAVRQVLEFLQELGVAPAATPKKNARPCHAIEERFERYLRQERRLAEASVLNATPFVRKFLDGRFGTARIALDELGPADVTRFVQRHAHRLSPKRAQLMVWALRSFLRFLHLRGLTGTDLAGAVPTVPVWRHSSLPRFIKAEQVDRILGTCNRGTAMGRRDYAVLLVLARLGLRAGEVTALTLEDIDWRSGEICVRGKGARIDRLPLPQDVGRALVAYLRHGRPRCDTRHVFVTVRAPIGPLSGQSSVACIVGRAVKRAGLNLPHRGAHLLRHSLASDLLRRGASLAEIGELLRHRHPDTTSIYAKIDVDTLRTLAQPWPEG